MSLQLHSRTNGIFILFPGIQISGNEPKGRAEFNCLGKCNESLTFREICTLQQTVAQAGNCTLRTDGGTQTGMQNNREFSCTFRLLSKMNCALLMGFIAESHKMHGEWRVNLGN